jgi:hypothetical protein
MKKAFIALAMTVLAACAGLVSGQTGPRTTKVMVNQDLLWIDQEPIIVRGTNVRIVWQIAAKGYEFPDDGIVFEKAPADEFQCRILDKRQTFQCVDRNSGPARYKYTIRLRRTGGEGNNPQPLDPWVVNDR